MPKKRVVYGDDGNPFLVDDLVVDHTGIAIPPDPTGVLSPAAVTALFKQILTNQRVLAEALKIPIRAS